MKFLWLIHCSLSQKIRCRHCLRQKNSYAMHKLTIKITPDYLNISVKAANLSDCTNWNALALSTYTVAGPIVSLVEIFNCIVVRTIIYILTHRKTPGPCVIFSETHASIFARCRQVTELTEAMDIHPAGQ